jgi:hypothetical protein
MEEKSKLDELKKQLDSRSFSPPSLQRRANRSQLEIEDIRKDWDQEEGVKGTPTEQNFNNQSLESMQGRKNKSFLKIFLLGSIVFFIIALAIAIFVILGGGNIISSDNVDISASGPASISGGEVLSLNIIVSNNNSTSLELADLIVEYPEGTRSAKNLSIEIPRERFSLGNIKPGDRANQEIEAILFGEEGSRERIKLTIEYRVAGSNAIFFKEKEYEVEISSSPVSFSIESLTDVNSGKEISLEVTLRSNSNNLLEDVLFTTEYPFGFTFKESIPRPSFDQNIWKIGDLSPGEEREIKITGILEGQDGEERIFRFFSGIQNEDQEKELKTAFVSSNRSIFIKKPFLALDIVINGNTSGNYNTPIGSTVNVDILWKNNLPTSVANVEIEALLGGDFDESSVFVERGFYNSVNNNVTWSQERNPVFESISPGESGRVGFRFNSLDPADNPLVNPDTSIDVSVRGRRLSESDVSEEITSSASRSIRFNTDISLIPRVVYSSGSIVNTGPVPPVAETETTYTVIWTLNNTVNDASNVVVSAKLPSYVRWTGKTVANAEKVTYNSVSREVSWDVGSLKARSGSGASLREASFQIGFLPSLSQVNQIPILIGSTEVSGKDDFTGVIIKNTKGELTTKISTDPKYQTGDGRVVRE